MATQLKGCNKRSDAVSIPLELFTCPEDRQALVHGVHVLNDGADDTTFSIGIVREGGINQAAAKDRLFRDEPIAAGESRRVVLGMGMQPGDTLFANSAASGVNFVPSVQEVL